MPPKQPRLNKEKLPLTPASTNLLAAYLSASSRRVTPKDALAQFELSLALCLNRTASQN